MNVQIFSVQNTETAHLIKNNEYWNADAEVQQKNFTIFITLQYYNIISANKD